jgi:hypothetical protein
VLQLSNDVGGSVYVRIAIIYIDQQFVIGQNLTDPPGSCNHVAPGDVTDVRQTVEASAETEAGEKEVEE